MIRTTLRRAALFALFAFTPLAASAQPAPRASDPVPDPGKSIASDDDSSALGDFVEDVSAESPFETASAAMRREGIARVLSSLPHREREVIEMRYGISGGHALTLEEVGRAFNITRERVRQIESRTLKKLQTLPDAQVLREAS